MPFPVSVSAALFPALLMRESVALAAPELCGANVKLKGTVWPAAIVRGKEIPASENSVLVRLADETVTLAPLAVPLAG